MPADVSLQQHLIDYPIHRNTEYDKEENSDSIKDSGHLQQRMVQKGVPHSQLSQH